MQLDIPKRIQNVMNSNIERDDLVSASCVAQITRRRTNVEGNKNKDLATRTAKNLMDFVIHAEAPRLNFSFRHEDASQAEEGSSALKKEACIFHYQDVEDFLDDENVVIVDAGEENRRLSIRRTTSQSTAEDLSSESQGVLKNITHSNLLKRRQLSVSSSPMVDFSGLKVTSMIKMSSLPLKLVNTSSILEEQ